MCRSSRLAFKRDIWIIFGLYMDYIGITLGLYRGYIRIVEKKMETRVGFKGLGFGV